MSIIPVLLLNITALLLSHKNKKDSAVNLLTLLMGGLCVIYLSALVNLLFWGTVLVYCALAGYGIYVACRMGFKNLPGALRSGMTVSLALFDLSYVVFALLYLLKKPLVYYWDELRIWAPSAKYVFYYNKLYSIGTNALTCDQNYPAGNALLTYFTQFFAGEFQDYFILLAYAVLLCAVFAAAAALVQKKTGSKPVAVGTFLLLLILPFTFIYHSAAVNYSQISHAYATTMVDYNIAVVFLAVIVLYLYSQGQLAYLLPMAFLVTVKKNGIFFSLIALCILACFAVFAPRQTRKKLPVLLRNAVCAAAVLAVCYGGWQWHVNRFTVPVVGNSYGLSYDHTDPAEPEQTVGEEPDPRFIPVSEATPLAIVIPRLRSARYQQILAEIGYNYKTNRETVFGRDVFLILGLAVLGVLSVIFSKKEDKLPLFLIVLGMTVGCYLYGLVIGYQMQFYHDLMVEYPRYMVNYYAAWVMLQIVLFMVFPSKKLALKTAFITVTVLFTVKNSVLWNPAMTVFDKGQNTYAAEQQLRAEFSQVKSQLSFGDRVCLVSPYQDTQLWYSFRYELLPYLCGCDTLGTDIDFSVGFCTPKQYNSEKPNMYFADKETYRQIMTEYFDYIYIYQPEEEFVASYADLFSDGIAEGGLYQVTQGDVPMRRVQ